MNIFNVIGSEVSKAVDYVVEKNRKTAMINRLRVVIKNERENTARAYVALGKYYMEHLRDANDEQAEQLCQAVEESERRMRKAFDKLDEITAPTEEEDDACADCNDDCDICPYYEDLNEVQRQELAQSGETADEEESDVAEKPFINLMHDEAAAEEERLAAEESEEADPIPPTVTAGKEDILGEAAEDEPEV
ncbi:hypothetical protein [Anaeromassilibacillus senegalensis]|uniref:hypothetical protein n=1 Tax=Anaeromassilibacillus senegalensis TaxID=1673717 RepID=UPI000682CEDE|nr:hypothetical protein [Anaeromassilibacillus senegalensis]